MTSDMPKFPSTWTIMHGGEADGFVVLTADQARRVHAVALAADELTTQAHIKGADFDALLRRLALLIEEWVDVDV